MTQYALMIARQMKYSPKDQNAWVRLERGCRLHDIGKVGVPDAVLQKAGKLTNEEFAKMRDHTIIGFNILSIRRFARSTHPWKRVVIALNCCVIGLLLVLVGLDVADLIS